MDRRVARRYLKQVPARFGDESNDAHVGATYDLSETGVLLRSSRIYPPSTLLSIKFILPRGKMAHCQGEVQWAKRVPLPLTRVIQKHGMGIALSYTSPEYHQFVKELSASRTGEAVLSRQSSQSA